MRTAANLWAVGSTCENMCKTLWSQSEGDQHAYNEKKKKKRPSIVVIKAVSTHLLGIFLSKY